jgi:hypothetical protein
VRRRRPGHGDDLRAAHLIDPSVLEEGDEPVVRLVAWDGPWPDGDPDANLKTDIAAYSHLDPLATIRVLADGTQIPVGAIVRYVLAKWASGGSEGVLELGPSTVARMARLCDQAEDAGTDGARLDAYSQLREMVSWLDASH